MKTTHIAIIGGTGIYNFKGITDLEPLEIKTEYGNVSVVQGKLKSKQLVFLARHGQDHSIAPGLINYRANIAALKQMGVKYVFATACSGSLNPEFKVGDLVLLDQFLEFTKNRNDTFLDGCNGHPLGHIDNTHPYCKMLGDYVSEAGKALGTTIKDKAVYCCVEGPRFESSAEIKLFRMFKADLVGQTNYPEVVLAREAELCYCAVGIVANMAAGISQTALTVSEVKKIMEEKMSLVQDVLTKTIEILDIEKDCSCHHLLDNAII